MVRIIFIQYSKYVLLLENQFPHRTDPKMTERGVYSPQLQRLLAMHIFELYRHKVRFPVIWRGRSNSSPSSTMLQFAKELLSQMNLLVAKDYL